MPSLPSHWRLLRSDPQALFILDEIQRLPDLFALLRGVIDAERLHAKSRGLGRYIDLLVDLLLIRRLPPFLPNIGKHLVKTPKIYIRDSGLVHALLNIGDIQALLGHPVAGLSWEGYVNVGPLK